MLTTTNNEAICPVCQTPSNKVHSRYTRSVHDLPWAELSIRFVLKVRRFLCVNPECKRVTFAERLGAAIPAWARRTQRYSNQLRELGLALGGEAGARLAAKLGLKASGDTILNLVAQTPLPNRLTPRILGIDDLALRKSQTYATLLVDLERKCIVDLLPGRESATIANWLKAHQGVQVISRDRAMSYADAAKVGAPEAVQVIDRFHLIKNLGESVEKVIKRQYATVRNLLAADPHGVIKRSSFTSGTKARLTWKEAQKYDRLQYRMALYEQVQNLHTQGYNKSEIGQELEISSYRVRELLKRSPHAKPYIQRPSKLDPYKPYLHQRFFEEGCQTTPTLWQELLERGYQGSRSYFNSYISQLRKHLNRLENDQEIEAGEASKIKPAGVVVSHHLYSPGKLLWWFILPAERLRESQRRKLEILCQGSSELALTYQLAQSFQQLYWERRSAGLAEWIERARGSGIEQWHSFANGIKRDEAAIKASIEMKWTNGPVEGRVNKVKLIKRQGYGRASFKLLRTRVLAA